MAKVRPYHPEVCAYCETPTWCEIRDNGKPQCRACKVVRFYEEVLYPPLGLHLQGWSRKVLRELYGTLRPESGLRQYRRGYISMGKQNGKSFLFGGLPIYHTLVEEGIEQPEAYSVASAKDQAAIVFKASALLIRKNPLLLARFKVLDSVKRILRRDLGGLYEVLSADGELQDGKRPSLLLFDELHRFTRKKAETVRTVLMKGMISRAPVVDGVHTGEPLMLQATTSGDEEESPIWFSEYEYARQVIAEPEKDRAYYAVIYQADPKRIEADPEYWKSREARVAANPSHEANGGFLADAEIEAECKEAQLRPGKKPDFIRLNLNVPQIATGTPEIDMTIWQKGGGGEDLRTWPEYDYELLIRRWGLVGRPCVAGNDLGWNTDMASTVFVFPPFGKDPQWKLLPFFWLPAGRISALEQRVRHPLASWVDRKFLETTPGAEIDTLAMIEKNRWGSRIFDLREVALDKWGGLKTAVELTLVPDGFTCSWIPQTFPGVSAATKRFLGIYSNANLDHGNHPILNWHASCLALKGDGGDNVKPVKPQRDVSSKRIDGIAAAITGMARALAIVPQESGVIEVW